MSELSQLIAQKDAERAELEAQRKINLKEAIQSRNENQMYRDVGAFSNMMASNLGQKPVANMQSFGNKRVDEAKVQQLQEKTPDDAFATKLKSALLDKQNNYKMALAKQKAALAMKGTNKTDFKHSRQRSADINKALKPLEKYESTARDFATLGKVIETGTWGELEKNKMAIIKKVMGEVGNLAEKEQALALDTGFQDQLSKTWAYITGKGKDWEPSDFATSGLTELLERTNLVLKQNITDTYDRAREGMQNSYYGTTPIQGITGVEIIDKRQRQGQERMYGKAKKEASKKDNRLSVLQQILKKL